LAFLPGIFSRFLVPHDLFYEAARGLRRLVLLLSCGVGVGSERESGIVVPQHGRYRFHVPAILERHRSEGVAQVVEVDAGKSHILQNLFVEIHHRVGRYISGCAVAFPAAVAALANTAMPVACFTMIY